MAVRWPFCHTIKLLEALVALATIPGGTLPCQRVFTVQRVAEPLTGLPVTGGQHAAGRWPCGTHKRSQVAHVKVWPVACTCKLVAELAFGSCIIKDGHRGRRRAKRKGVRPLQPGR